MTSASVKGSHKEAQCLKELEAYAASIPGTKILSTWKVTRQGGKFARFQGGQDFLGGWDIAMLSENNYNRTLWLVQVKSRYSTKEHDRLRGLAYGNCYLGVYNEPRQYTLRLAHFWLIKV